MLNNSHKETENITIIKTPYLGETLTKKNKIIYFLIIGKIYGQVKTNIFHFLFFFIFLSVAFFYLYVFFLSTFLIILKI